MTQSGKEHLDELWRRGKDFLGTDFGILGGAMSWISERNLVAAISNGGGFGVVAAGAMPGDSLEAEIKGARALTTKPFGVNIVTMRPDLDEVIDLCGANKVSHIVLAGGLPSAAAIKRAKDTGAKVICFAPALVIAKKLIRSGADALIIEGAEAGGHIGPVSTSVLAQEILPQMGGEVPIFVAGGIGRGEAIVSFLEMGASGVQLGTRFVCATECVAHPNFKQAFIRAAARDAQPTVQVDPAFPVIPVRALINKGSQRFIEFQHEIIARWRNGEVDQKAAQLEIEHFWVGALRRAVVEGDVENGSVMAGQSVGLVTQEQSTTDILKELVAQAVVGIESGVRRRIA